MNKKLQLHVQVIIISFSAGIHHLFRIKSEHLFIRFSFPLLYPDFQIGRFLYLKRIRTNLFVDWGKVEYSFRTKNIGQYTKATSEMLSTGLDNNNGLTYTENHFFR
jgi:hypothetical protein